MLSKSKDRRHVYTRRDIPDSESGDIQVDAQQIRSEDLHDPGYNDIRCYDAIVHVK